MYRRKGLKIGVEGYRYAFDDFIYQREIEDDHDGLPSRGWRQDLALGEIPPPNGKASRAKAQRPAAVGFAPDGEPASRPAARRDGTALTA